MASDGSRPAKMAKVSATLSGPCPGSLSHQVGDMTVEVASRGSGTQIRVVFCIQALGVKNKHAATIQISAEQLLREANERQIEYVAPVPKQNITDPQELEEFKLNRRKNYEDNIRSRPDEMPNWVKYAVWEDSQGETERARSVFERALDVNHRAITVWLKYAEIEMKNRQVNHARNIFDRAVLILPRVNQFWFKYTYMEEKLGNIAGARQIFERWMEWHPDEDCWFAYINFEMRYGEVERARGIYERLIVDHCEPKHWIKYAKFELKNRENDKAREVFERAVEFFGEDHLDETLFIEFARFEERQKEYERARVIYKYALDRIPKEQAKQLFDAYTSFEKRFGNQDGIESVIHNKRRFQYEKEIKENPHNYDAWFDYIRLAESEGDVAKARDIYERAIANVPLDQDKRYWRRYIYLWVYYAVFEELTAKDADRTRAVYQACLQLLPHKTFTFAKVWLYAAQFEIRQKNLKAARQLLGRSLGLCPKDKLYKGYIELELELREFDRCRTLYNKYLEFNPATCQTWVQYAELEAVLGDYERARAIFELAIDQPLLDMPEILWKAYIDFEIEQDEVERARQLYERLLEKTSHVRVWISYAQFEASLEVEDNADRAREVFRQGHKEVKKQGDKAARKVLLDAWKAFEEEQGDADALKEVTGLMPKQIKRRREVFAEDGTSDGWEEYWDYVFPDEETTKPHLKLLQIAQQWKQKQQAEEA
ncbi:uncharacterized protein MONBRDRAFT_33965 [Monosiga brevicollis MX1]|uniref:Pre-mRNA-splicing factor Syf1/CRNKL1-like C-terminal HAT-repeats domain-containing protein n=1 Tax=Monosiga brevicollis TaxID=81824 RepID=A9V8T3_MONBE|nr:uncharacterized protein MONBRDRAFT_33965 [Monosiga brevicollis MX1]EDQ85928.1 predicted protein [Monosiga brevicollis MX1]|eukprot:XP_001749122.1 hypothetical protein [Monosiga brevicollis MX1]